MAIEIMTALIAEQATVSRLLIHAEACRIDDDPNSYEVGYLPTTEHATPHRVAVVMLSQGKTCNAAYG